MTVDVFVGCWVLSFIGGLLVGALLWNTTSIRRRAGWICPGCGVFVSCVRHDHYHATSDCCVCHIPKPEADK